MTILRRRARRDVAAAVILAAAVGACGTAGPAGPPAASTSSTTAAAPCPTFGSTGARSGPAAVTRTPAVALLRNVQVQASSCVDEVSFLFMGGVPAYSARYQSGPLTEDPSGAAADVAGSDHLVIRFEPAAGVDLSSGRPTTVYDGPTSLRPAAPSGVAEVRRLGDFESVMTWVMGLGARRPYQVLVRGDQLVVRVPSASPRATRCEAADPAFSVGYPSSWFAELSDRWSCRYFDPLPFVVYPATDNMSWAVTVAQADLPASGVVARLTSSGPDRPLVTSRATRVGGVPATVLDVTTTGAGLTPAGYVFRVYVLDSGPLALTIESAPGPPGPRSQRSRDAADQVAALITRS